MTSTFDSYSRAQAELVEALKLGQAEHSKATRFAEQVVESIVQLDGKLGKVPRTHLSVDLTDESSGRTPKVSSAHEVRKLLGESRFSVVSTCPNIHTSALTFAIRNDDIWSNEPRHVDVIGIKARYHGHKEQQEYATLHERIAKLLRTGGGRV